MTINLHFVHPALLSLDEVGGAVRSQLNNGGCKMAVIPWRRHVTTLSLTLSAGSWGFVGHNVASPFSQLVPFQVLGA